MVISNIITSYLVCADCSVSRAGRQEVSQSVTGWHYLSSSTLSNTASFVLRAVYSVKDHHQLNNPLPLLKKACVRQAVSDKWPPPELRSGHPS